MERFRLSSNGSPAAPSHVAEGDIICFDNIEDEGWGVLLRQTLLYLPSLTQYVDTYLVPTYGSQVSFKDDIFGSSSSGLALA